MGRTDLRLSARPVADRRVHHDEIVRAVVVSRFRRCDPVGGAQAGILWEISLAYRGAPTVADLAGSESFTSDDHSAAIQYRSLDR